MTAVLIVLGAWFALDAVLLGVWIAAVETSRRRNRRPKPHPYFTIDTEEARARHRQLADETRARREAAERRARGGAV